MEKLLLTLTYQFFLSFSSVSLMIEQGHEYRATALLKPCAAQWVRLLQACLCQQVCSGHGTAHDIPLSVVRAAHPAQPPGSWSSAASPVVPACMATTIALKFDASKT